MTIFRHELKQGRKSFIIWTASITLLIVVCVFLFPEMKGQMDAVSDMFASMGSFTAMFGMDQLDFGQYVGYYSIECGNVLGLGGAFFAALLGISALAKEEKERTAEYLLTHPVSRFRIITKKLLSVMFQILVMNLIIWLSVIASTAAIGETIPWKDLNLIHLAFLLMQFELAGICFGISAFLSRGGLGLGLGIAILSYFVNLISNITESAAALKYITPFSYTEGADIVTNGKLDTTYVLIGMAIMVIAVAAGYWKYNKKDIK